MTLFLPMPLLKSTCLDQYRQSNLSGWQSVAVTFGYLLDVIAARLL